MKILSVTLENIKGYEEATLTFGESVNFISGVNGAGKTTVIEAIGWALFDSTESFRKQEHFLRWGAKKGRVTVDFIGNDQGEYRATRLVPGGSWTCLDRRTGMELAKGGSDCREFLKKVLQTGGHYELNELFEKIVGVGQGTFTEPFLKTETQRRDHFNRILNLDVYRQTYKELLGTARSLEKRDGDLRVEEGRLEEKTARIPAVDQGLKAVVKELAAGQKERDRLEKALDKRRREALVLKQAAEAWQEAKNRVNALEGALEGLAGQAEEAGRGLQEAREAQGRLVELAPAYGRYQALAVERRELEEKRRQRDSLKIQEGELSRKLSALVGRLELGQKRADGETKRLAEEEEHFLGALERLETPLGEARRKLQEQQKLGERVGHWLAEARDGEGDIQSLLQELGRLAEKTADVCTRVLPQGRELAKAVQGKGVLTEQAVLVEGLSSERLALQESLARVEARLGELQTSREMLAGGRCPILHGECPRAQDPDQEFGTKEKELQGEAHSLKEGLKRKSLALKDAEGAARQLIQLAEQERVLLGLRQELSGVRQALKEQAGALVGRNLPLAWETRLDSIPLAGLAEGTALIHKLGAYPGLPDLGDQEFRTDPDGYFARWQTGLNALVTWAEGFMLGVGQVREALLRRQQAEEKGAALEAGRLEKEGEALQAAGKNLAAAKERLAGEVRENLRLEGEKQGLEGELTRIGQALAPFAELDHRLNGVVGEMEVLEPGRKAYEGAQALAQTLGDREERAANLTAALERATQEGVKARQTMEGLADQVKEDRLTLLEQEISEEEGRRGQILGLLERAQREQASLVQERETLAEAEAGLEKVRRERRKVEEAQEILKKMRQVFNLAPSRMADVFLQHISREADGLYRRLSGEGVSLRWTADYEVELIDQYKGKERVRIFRQLSGGEQMSAALAVRLSLMKHFSNCGVGFFDEPTSHLDVNRRGNLADVLPTVMDGLEQLFVISHDDTFDAYAENVVRIGKDQGEGAHLLAE